MTDTDRLIRQFIADGSAAFPPDDQDPRLFVVAALAGTPSLLDRAAATTTRDRQLVAIAGAYLAGDTDRVDALAREHLVDHPDDILVAWIAGQAKHLRETS